MKSDYNLLRGGKSHLAVLVLLAWPAIVEQILLTMVNYVDAAMVGSLGANATAAVGINSSAIWTIGGLLNAMAVGYSVQVAHRIGADQLDEAKSVIRQAILATAVGGGGLMLACLPIAGYVPLWLGADAAILPDAQAYLRIVVFCLPFQAAANIFSAILRCMGDTKTPLLLNTCTNLLNILLNTLFIFPTRQVRLGSASFTMWGAGLGVAGAALGTALSAAVIGVVITLCLCLRPGPLRIHLHESYAPDPVIIRSAFYLGLPVALDRITISGGQIIMTKIVSSLGTIPLAANHVAITAEGISYLPANGISFAVTTLVGQAAGAKEYPLTQRYGALSAKLGFLFSAVMGALIFLFAAPLSGIFSSDPEVISLAANMLRIVAVSEPFFGVSIVLSGMLRGVKDPRPPFYFNTIGMWGIRVVLAPILAFVFHVGLASVWIAMVADLVFRGVLCIWYFKKEKWLKKLREMDGCPV